MSKKHGKNQQSSVVPGIRTDEISMRLLQSLLCGYPLRCQWREDTVGTMHECYAVQLKLKEESIYCREVTAMMAVSLDGFKTIHKTIDQISTAEIIYEKGTVEKILSHDPDRLNEYRTYQSSFWNHLNEIKDETAGNTWFTASVSENVLNYLAEINRIDRPIQIRNSQHLYLTPDQNEVSSRMVYAKFGGGKNIYCAVSNFGITMDHGKNWFHPVYYNAVLSLKEKKKTDSSQEKIYELKFNQNKPKVSPLILKMYEMNRERTRNRFNSNHKYDENWRIECGMTAGELISASDAVDAFRQKTYAKQGDHESTEEFEQRKNRIQRSKFNLFTRSMNRLAAQINNADVIPLNAREQNVADSKHIVKRTAAAGYYLYRKSDKNEKGYVRLNCLHPISKIVFEEFRQNPKKEKKKNKKKKQGEIEECRCLIDEETGGFLTLPENNKDDWEMCAFYIRRDEEKCLPIVLVGLFLLNGQLIKDPNLENKPLCAGDPSLSSMAKYYNDQWLIGQTDSIEQPEDDTGMHAEEIRTILFGLGYFGGEKSEKTLSYLKNKINQSRELEKGKYRSASSRRAAFLMSSPADRNETAVGMEDWSAFRHQVADPLMKYCTLDPEFSSDASGNHGQGTPLNQTYLPECIFLGGAVEESKENTCMQIYTADNKDEELYDVDRVNAVRHCLQENSVTYLDGAPGTGKSVTVTDVILSCFLNDKKVLFVTNNNLIVDDMYERVNRFFGDRNDGYNPAPMFRYGNTAKIRESMSKAATFMDYQFPESVRTLDDVENEKNSLYSCSEFREEVKGSLLEKAAECQETLLDDDQYYENLRSYMKSGQPQKLAMSLKNEESLKLFTEAFPMVFSTCASVSSLGRSRTQRYDPGEEGEPYFDLVIIDEASQVSITSGMLAAVRGKSLLLCGDRHQLRPVLNIDMDLDTKFREAMNVSNVYSYTVLSMMGAFNNIDVYAPKRSFQLSHHYRCREEIFNYSRNQYYRYAEVKRTKEEIIEKEAGRKMPEYPLVWLSLKGTEEHPTDWKTEADAVNSIVHKLIEEGYQPDNIAVLSPFSSQAASLRKTLNWTRHICDSMESDGVETGTIHTFEGKERDIVILSTGVTSALDTDTYNNFLAAGKELLNVAITRAKDCFILIADQDAFQKFHEIFQTQRKEKSDDAYDFFHKITDGFENFEHKKYKAYKLTTYDSNSVSLDQKEKTVGTWYIYGILNQELAFNNKEKNYIVTDASKISKWKNMKVPDMAVVADLKGNPRFCGCMPSNSAEAELFAYHEKIPCLTIRNCDSLSNHDSDCLLRAIAMDEDHHRHYYNTRPLIRNIMKTGMRAYNRKYTCMIDSYPRIQNSSRKKYAVTYTFHKAGMSEKDTFEITWYDKAVMDEIYSMWKTGEGFLSLRNLLRKLTGNPDLSIAAASTNVKELEQSMRKLQETEITLDIKEIPKEPHDGSDRIIHREGSLLYLPESGKYGKKGKFNLNIFDPEKNLILYGVEELMNPINVFYTDEQFPSGKEQIKGRNNRHGWLLARYLIYRMRADYFNFRLGRGIIPIVLYTQSTGEGALLNADMKLNQREDGKAKSASINNAHSVQLVYVKELMNFFIKEKKEAENCDYQIKSYAQSYPADYTIEKPTGKKKWLLTIDYQKKNEE